MPSIANGKTRSNKKQYDFMGVYYLTVKIFLYKIIIPHRKLIFTGGIHMTLNKKIQKIAILTGGVIAAD
ncbi:hypothetical protein JXC34_06555 [Candidatus Woesearchaeota archaeon]|nr:hypothetical protein [Candidatus Woesearchaeota archaeon]